MIEDKAGPSSEGDRGLFPAARCADVNQLGRGSNGADDAWQWQEATPEETLPHRTHDVAHSCTARSRRWNRTATLTSSREQMTRYNVVLYDVRDDVLLYVSSSTAVSHAIFQMFTLLHII